MIERKQAEGSEPAPRLGGVLEALSLLWELNHAMERSSLRMRRALGITAQQRLLLRIAGRFPELTAGTLARLLHVDAGTLSVSLARLEKRGLIARTRGSADRRRVAIGLTAAGRAHDRPVAGTVEGAVERKLAKSSPAELRAFERFIRGLIEELDAPAPANAERPLPRSR